MQNKIEKAMELLMSLNDIEESEYAKLLENELGVELLSLFSQYCQELVPAEEDQLIDTLVHLMITGYLIRKNEESSLSKPILEIP